MAFSARFITCLVLVACIAASVDATISCGSVSSQLAPCLNYLTNGGTVPPECCVGVKALNNAAQTTADRQQACQCLQAAAHGINGLKPDLAEALPRACGVNIPYPISFSTNCNNIK